MLGIPRLALVTLASALSASCVVGPDYVKPALDSPARFNNQASLALRQVQMPADLSHWWDGFNDPMLSKLVVLAQADNLDLAQAVARVSQARALLGTTKAALLPSAELNAQANRAHQSLQSPLGRLLNASTPDFDRDGAYYEAGIEASWELDFFGGRRRDREAALAELQATQAGAVAARLVVAAQTADTYLLIRGLQERLAIAREQAATQRHLLATVKLQYEAGVVAELQMRQAESLVYQVDASVPALEAALEVALNALDVSLGTQPGTHHDELSGAVAVPAAPAIADAGGPADLMRRRPDLIAAGRRLAASSADIGAAVSQYYPKVSLKGLIGAATTSFGGVFSGAANQAQTSVGLRWRLFDFARIDAEIAATRGRNSEALAAYKLAVLRASEDVENAISALVRREEQARTLAKGEQALGRARAASVAAYEGGAVSLIEVLDADIRLLATRDARALARMESARAAVASFKALGGGWDTSASVEGATDRSGEIASHAESRARPVARGSAG